jgi:hypothetical protein
MFPSSTSLIPATVSLLGFFNNNGFTSFFQNYPYWYYGSTPFKYLIGPVIPLIEYFLHLLFPTATIFTLVYWLIGLSIVVGLVGWIILIRQILKKDGITLPIAYYLLLIACYFLTPWKYLNGLAIDEGTYIVARGVIPFVLVIIWTYLRRRSNLWLVLSSLSVAILLLINTNVLLTIIIGSVALCLTISLKNNKFRHLEKKLRRIIYPIAIGFVVVTMWYGPKFWLVQLYNPSIGGVVGIGAILKGLDFLKNIIPLAMAVTVVYFNTKVKNRLTVFGLTWTFTFIFLTLYRFIANPDFFLDYTSWLFEVEVGALLVVASIFQSIPNFKSLVSKPILILITMVFILFGITFYAYKSLDSPKIFTSDFPKSTNSLSLLKNLPPDSKVFITGANTFWLNSMYNINQVRGGRDEVSIDPNWRRAAYTFREEKKKELIYEQIQKINLDYVLINTLDSPDYYKDYKNLNVWEGIGTKVASKDGDILLKVK